MIIHIYDEQIGYIIKSCIGELYTTEVINKPNGKCDLLLTRSEHIQKFNLNKDKTIAIDVEIPLPIRSNKVKEVINRFIDKNNLRKLKPKVQKAETTSKELQEALKHVKPNKKK